MRSVSFTYLPRMSQKRADKKGAPLTNGLMVFSNFKYPGQPHIYWSVEERKKLNSSQLIPSTETGYATPTNMTSTKTLRL